MSQQQTISVETVKAILNAFNAHDLDAIMEFSRTIVRWICLVGQIRGDSALWARRL